MNTRVYVKNELEKYLIHLDCSYIDYGINSLNIYKYLFIEPVERIFFWKEEDFSGSLFVIFKFENFYITVYGNYGSCPECDDIEGLEDPDELYEKIQDVFNNIQVYHSLNEIEIIDFYHPELKYALTNFKYMSFSDDLTLSDDSSSEFD
jgi:hypothetical protein